MKHWISSLAGAALTVFALTDGLAAPAAGVKLLNVSYDVTREFYQDYDAAFTDYWKKKTGDDVSVSLSNGGSSKQVRSVIEGLAADVVTMNQPLDVDMLHTAANLIPANWADRLPNHSVPYTSTILFVVRKGNPQHIHDWDDLVRPGVSVVIPNPKTSGNGRYSYLAAWGYALKKPAGDEPGARKFLAKLFANVPVLDTGGRGATTTFAERGIGDVLLTFENETALIRKQFASSEFEVVVPSVSILAENPVTWVDKVVKKHGTEKVAQGYLEYLYSDPAQVLAAEHFFRPQNTAILARYQDRFKPLKLFTVDEVFGSWTQAQKTHFADNGLFDQLYQPK
jgi:sulfate/thiosulfate-binding protein